MIESRINRELGGDRADIGDILGLIECHAMQNDEVSSFQKGFTYAWKSNHADGRTSRRLKNPYEAVIMDISTHFDCRGVSFGQVFLAADTLLLYTTGAESPKYALWQSG